MESTILEVSQMLSKHPVLNEKDTYKKNYIAMLEYFASKYSSNDEWSKQTLSLYKKVLLNGTTYTNENATIQTIGKRVLKTLFRSFRIVTYRFCIVFDIVFICAYDNPYLQNSIIDELSSLYPKRYQKQLHKVIKHLSDQEENLDSIKQIEYVKECWDLNKQYQSQRPLKIIVTANMSAGKSTLLNALVGRKVNKTQNDACTAKIHYIVNKPYEDNYCYELDFEMCLDADKDTLMKDNTSNNTANIIVGANFRTISQIPTRIWYIDTPGVNSSQDTIHKDITEKTILAESSDLLLYVLNGENIGTDDDRKHLVFVQNNYHGQVIFVVNKLDRFRKKEDSVSETLSRVRADLQTIGFQNPVVVPVSSYAAYLAKQNMFGEQLDEDEVDELERMKRKLNKDEYKFDTYYPNALSNDKTIDADNSDQVLLLHSGIIHLENLIYNSRR